MNRIENLEDVLISELRDLYSAEQQILAAFPRMVERIGSKDMKQALSEHMEQTKGQLARLDRISEIVGERVSGKHCEGIEGLIREGDKEISFRGNPSLLDVILTGACQRIEHYEIAGYTTARAIAEQLGMEEVADLLQETLDEESDADERLTQICEADILPSCTYEEPEAAEDEVVERYPHHSHR